MRMQFREQFPLSLRGKALLRKSAEATKTPNRKISGKKKRGLGS